MRLFIAIQLNEEMKDALTELQYTMQSHGVRGNFSRRENLHLTLAFIGEYPDPYDVKEVIERIDFEPFRIQLDGVGSFGSLWWAGIKEDDSDGVAPGDGQDSADGTGRPGSPELRSLAKRVRRGLADVAIPYDRKKFSPHITLVRKPQIRGERVGKGGIPEEVLQELPQTEMIVDHISLMRSDRGKHGMIYTEL